MVAICQEQQPNMETKVTFEESDLEQIVSRIKELQVVEKASKTQLIRNKIEQGRELKRLKAATSHGQWTSALAGLRINESTAQRLMKIASSWLGDQTLTLGQDLLELLPVDVQKLAKLADLTIDQARKLLVDDVDFDEMKREEVREAVDALLPGNARAATRGTVDTAQDEIPVAAVRDQSPTPTISDSLAAPPLIQSTTSSPDSVAEVASYLTYLRQLIELKAPVLSALATTSEELRHEAQDLTELGTQVLAAVLEQLKSE